MTKEPTVTIRDLGLRSGDRVEEMGSMLETEEVFEGGSVRMTVVEGARDKGDTCFMGGGANASGLRKTSDLEV